MHMKLQIMISLKIKIKTENNHFEKLKIYIFIILNRASNELLQILKINKKINIERKKLIEYK